MKLIIKKHAKARMIERLFTLSEVKEAVRDGKYIFDGVVAKSTKSYVVVHKDIRLGVIENSKTNTIIIKTVMPTKYLQNKLDKEKELTNISITKLMESAKSITRKDVKKELYKKENRKKVLSV